ncbi:MAG: serine hydrolase [Ignavibacteriaceae bacterium]
MNKVFVILVLIPLILYTGNDKLEQRLEKSDSIYNVIIEKNDSLIFRKYYNGKFDSSLVNIQSVTKSILAILIGIAIDKQILKSIDQKIAEYFPEINFEDDTLKKQITIRHLLNQTSGLRAENIIDLEGWINSPNHVEYVLSFPLNSIPGELYNYNSAASHLLSVILQRAAKQSTEQFAADNLFKPLGIVHFKWEQLNDGYFDGGGLLSIWMRGDDLLKLGQLILNKGKWNNRHLVSEGWINELLNKSNKVPAHWGLKGSLHGMCWYTAVYKNIIVHFAMGYGGQYIFIIPQMKSVIVANHNHDTAEGIKQSNDFFEYIFPLLIDKVTY